MRRRRAFGSGRHQGPVIEVEQDLGQILAVLAFQFPDRGIADGDQPQADRADTWRRGLALSSTSDQALTVVPEKQGFA